MRMDKSKFVKIAASIGVSSFLLTGCADNDEESTQKESSAVKVDGTKQESEQETLNCDDKAPTTENIEKEELCRENHSPATFNNEGSHLPILPFVAGYLLASKTSNMYNTAKPNLMKKPYTNNFIPYSEKDERRTGGSGGGYYGGTSSNNDSSKKVDLNKQQPNNSTKVTPDSNTSKSSTTQTPKVNSGSSGIGNAKAPAGS
ncbi:hypothetical protein [Bacillus paramycoides]|uniref:Lipoprotein n=1 Tax=Bacillus paramycoides TaxID=2026194 RepID=A0A1J9UGU3_9BACI|nr:hypothetical protein [Bacillus paramycoides]MED0970585.1 hypothetical protein [Bacillus paramycoides]MED0982075.1 hypothetical protein [Bacillus paramycoides]MED0984457.1 hypothetical protein [Bacillus paramycoides]MED1091259.1 hypothetical protein [Bacillus paramycoides]MED1103368.1 hypothetical protein [Bacillus paramycoides]